MIEMHYNRAMLLDLSLFLDFALVGEVYSNCL